MDGIWAYKRRIGDVVRMLEGWRKLRGNDVPDLNYGRTVNEILFPPAFAITSEPFEDEAEYLNDGFTLHVLTTNWHVWHPAVQHSVGAQMGGDKNTRRATVALPHYCLSLVSFYARGHRATAYAYWRSLEHKKIAADMVTIQRLAKEHRTAAGCSEGDVFIQIGSYHKEVS